MSFLVHRAALVLLATNLAFAAEGQVAETSRAASVPEAASLEHVPRVPGVGTIFRGFNAGFAFAGVHDSFIGWYNVFTPAVSYTFSGHYSFDASVSIYPYRLIQNQDSDASANQRLVVTKASVGDTLLGFHATFSPRGLQNTITASMTAPTGSRTDGLGTGKVTVDFSDHIERYFGKTGGILDVGVGDSSGLFNRLVTEDYNALGPIAHFQTGVVVWLPGRSYVQSVAYEQLPLGDQKLYTTLTRPGLPNRTVVSGRNISEDNGFTTSVGIPLTSHLTLSSYYNRSLRLHLDTTSVGITYVLRGTPKEPSMIDRALREAATGSSR